MSDCRTPKYAGTTTALIPMPRPITNLPIDRSTALSAAAISTGPVMKKIELNAMHGRRPNANIAAPPMKVPKNAPACNIKTNT